jgi:hypothetical protein
MVHRALSRKSCGTNLIIQWTLDMTLECRVTDWSPHMWNWHLQYVITLPLYNVTQYIESPSNPPSSLVSSSLASNLVQAFLVLFLHDTSPANFIPLSYACGKVTNYIRRYSPPDRLWFHGLWHRVVLQMGQGRNYRSGRQCNAPGPHRTRSIFGY